ncbi:MAG: ribosome silencing factor [Lautropia sp.]
MTSHRTQALRAPRPAPGTAERSATATTAADAGGTAVNPAITRLQRVVVDALEDIKAQDISVYNTTGLSDLFDRVVVASATSNRQTRALAAHLRDKVKEKGFEVIATEGEDGGEWVLVDLGDIVVHIMQPAIRTYYNLEELWGAKPVRMKINGVTRAAPAARARLVPVAPARRRAAGG